MSDSATITTTTRIDLGALGGRLVDAERKVLARYGKQFRDALQSEWEGWEYRARPKKAPRLVSRRAWKQTIDSRPDGQPVIRIANHARDWRTKTRAYVAYIHRAGDPEPWFPKAWATVRAQLVPSLARDLAAAVARAAMVRRPPTRIRTPRAGESAVLRGEF